jgi:D-serine deaminase-like pyridoxal phosphate-dependent protein
LSRHAADGGGRARHYGIHAEGGGGVFPRRHQRYLYAVGIVPNKLDHALRLIREGLRLTLLLESVAMAEQVARHGAEHGVCYDVMIEIDTDGHRSGVKPDDPVLLQIAAALQGGARLKGVMTHAGASYDCTAPEALQAMAEQERSRCVAAATLLRNGGHGCEAVSVGSTPTALSAQHLEGVTEVRAVSISSSTW